MVRKHFRQRAALQQQALQAASVIRQAGHWAEPASSAGSACRCAKQRMWLCNTAPCCQRHMRQAGKRQQSLQAVQCLSLSSLLHQRRNGLVPGPKWWQQSASAPADRQSRSMDSDSMQPLPATLMQSCLLAGAVSQARAYALLWYPCTSWLLACRHALCSAGYAHACTLTSFSHNHMHATHCYRTEVHTLCKSKQPVSSPLYNTYTCMHPSSTLCN